MPDLARLSPQRGLKRLFGVEGLVEVVKSLAKAGILVWALWRAISDVLPRAMSAMSWHPVTLLTRMLSDLVHLSMLIIGCQLVVALLDVTWTRLRFTSRLRMSLEEIKQEHKQAEGDPRIKAKLKQIRMAKSRQRMMARVPQATVVITNPTHYAVALVYDRGSQAAPRVVAKGMDEVALRIRTLASQHGVAIVANPPLARALYTLPLDAEVPAEHFKAVAEIIAYVWRLRGQRSNDPPVS